uniref:PBCV-1 P8-like minor capsid protein n=1 Tax=Clandestinovirus TaxID=2831644 RepID=A0A8F8KNS6_9VIRU|nr:PBCV-1 P8-like minor capsid protein [Clandestinovirus]
MNEVIVVYQHIINDMSYDYPAIEPRFQSTVSSAHDSADQGMAVENDASAWNPDIQTEQEMASNSNMAVRGAGRLGSFFDQAEDDFEVKPGQTDMPMNMDELYDRYSAVPATQRPSNPGWNAGVKPAQFEGPNQTQGPVNQLFFSPINVRQIGDFLESKGLGRPSATELLDDMTRIYQEAPDFYEFGPIRTRNDVVMQLMRLNSLLLNDILPKYKTAKWSWERYQQDSTFGIGHQLIDRPVHASEAKQYIEFNNRF